MPRWPKPEPAPPEWGVLAATAIGAARPWDVIVVPDEEYRARVLAALAVLGLDRRVEVLPVAPIRFPKISGELRKRIANSGG